MKREIARFRGNFRGVCPVPMAHNRAAEAYCTWRISPVRYQTGSKKAGLFFGQGLIHMDECAKIRFIRTGHEAIPMTPQKLYEKEKT